MKKLLIFSLLVLLVSPMAYGQNHSFSSFLEQLNELPLVGADAFGDSIMSPNIDEAQFREFLPKASSVLKMERSAIGKVVDTFARMVLSLHSCKHISLIVAMAMKNGSWRIW